MPEKPLVPQPVLATAAVGLAFAIVVVVIGRAAGMDGARLVASAGLAVCAVAFAVVSFSDRK